jgi:hypothetical protein
LILIKQPRIAKEAWNYYFKAEEGDAVGGAVVCHIDTDAKPGDAPVAEA